MQLKAYILNYYTFDTILAGHGTPSQYKDAILPT